MLIFTVLDLCSVFLLAWDGVLPCVVFPVLQEKRPDAGRSRVELCQRGRNGFLLLHVDECSYPLSRQHGILIFIGN